jgi:hypothetical protein
MSPNPPGSAKKSASRFPMAIGLGLPQHKVQFSSHEQLLGFLHHLLRASPMKMDSLLSNDLLKYIEIATGYPPSMVKAYLHRQTSNSNLSLASM